MTVTRSQIRYPGITKITHASGDVRYRLIVSVGKRPGTTDKWIQECYPFRTMTEARQKQNEIKNSRDKGTLVKRDNVTFDELCQRWLDSRSDVREVTRLGYQSWLKAVREQLGQAKVQDLTRTDIENVIKGLGALTDGATYLRPSEKGVRSAASALGAALARGI